MSTVHVVPLGDLIDHLVPGGLMTWRGEPGRPARWLSIEADPNYPEMDCPCEPATEYVPPGGWLITHHSLDGREHDER